MSLGAHKFNVWFDASLRVLGDSIAETGSLYAPKVERLFERGVSALDAEWRAQFPDDATYVSEMSKKEYPSEANAVMRAATRGDEKEARASEEGRARRLTRGAVWCVSSYGCVCGITNRKLPLEPLR